MIKSKSPDALRQQVKVTNSKLFDEDLSLSGDELKEKYAKKLESGDLKMDKFKDYLAQLRGAFKKWSEKVDSMNYELEDLKIDWNKVPKRFHSKIVKNLELNKRFGLIPEEYRNNKKVNKDGVVVYKHDTPLEQLPFVDRELVLSNLTPYLSPEDRAAYNSLGKINPINIDDKIIDRYTGSVRYQKVPIFRLTDVPFTTGKGTFTVGELTPGYDIIGRDEFKNVINTPVFALYVPRDFKTKELKFFGKEITAKGRTMRAPEGITHFSDLKDRVILRLMKEYHVMYYNEAMAKNPNQKTIPLMFHELPIGLRKKYEQEALKTFTIDDIKQDYIPLATALTQPQYRDKVWVDTRPVVEEEQNKRA